MGLVRGEEGMAFDGGVRARERARGGTITIFNFLVQKKASAALLGSVLAFFGDTACDRPAPSMERRGCAHY